MVRPELPVTFPKFSQIFLFPFRVRSMKPYHHMPSVVLQMELAPITEFDHFKLSRITNSWGFVDHRNCDWQTKLVASGQNIHITFTVSFAASG